MRVLRIICAIALMIGLRAAAQTSSANSASPCAGCHKAQSASQPQTPMGRALTLPDVNPLLKANPKLTAKRGAFSYSIDTQGDKSLYSVTDGTKTITLPIRWNFGAGVQAWLFPHNGKFYESMVSYYPASGALDVTVGDEGLKPQTLEDAIGRVLTEKDLKECFGCHATNAVAKGQLNLDALQTGVTCEHCHVGSETHMVDAMSGQMDSIPPRLGKLSAEGISNFCGQCHRSWETVIRNHWWGEVNVRFAPYRLANSKCFDGTDARISCLACHDPHQDLVKTAAAYDSKCLACHGDAAVTGAASSRAEPALSLSKGMPAPHNLPKTCPVAKSECVTCHMPKVKLPDENVMFTDHQIRVVKAGERYPN